jgi:D-glycerate 3-kinase
MMTDRLEIYPLLFGDRPFDLDALSAERDDLLRLARRIFPGSRSASIVPGLKDQRDVYLPIIQYAARLAESRPCLFLGLIGPPGSGKTTVTAFWAGMFKAAYGLDSIVLSSDDFYLSKEDRRKLGYAWRGSPETHDIQLFRDTMHKLRLGEVPLAVPRFDAGADDRSAPRMIERQPRICILEGWMIGKLTEMAFGSLRPFFDFLIYLDMPDEQTRRYRFKRDAALYDGSGGHKGFSPEEMSSFWSQSLKPNIDSFVTPYSKLSDIVLRLGAGHRVVSVTKDDRSGLVDPPDEDYDE